MFQFRARNMTETLNIFKTLIAACLDGQTENLRLGRSNRRALTLEIEIFEKSIWDWAY